jgi:hypothetical protein
MDMIKCTISPLINGALPRAANVTAWLHKNACTSLLSGTWVPHASSVSNGVGRRCGCCDTADADADERRFSTVLWVNAATVLRRSSYFTDVDDVPFPMLTWWNRPNNLLTYCPTHFHNSKVSVNGQDYI